MNKYKGSIIETYKSAAYRRSENKVYLWSSSGRYVVDHDVLGIKLDIEKDLVGEILLDGFWYRDASGNLKYKDIFHKNIKYEIPDNVVGRPDYSIDKKIIGSNASWDESACLYVFDAEANESHVLKGNYPYHSSDGNCIYVHYKTLSCFNLKLEKLWEVPLKNRNKSNANPTPLFFGDLVIIVNNENIFAFNKNNGEPSWGYAMDRNSQCITVTNNRVYLTQGFDLLVLDAKTGEKILQEPIDFKPEMSTSYDKDGTRNMMVYPVDENIIMAFADGNPDIKFYTADGQTCLQSLNIEDAGYMLYTRNNPPIVKDGVIYLPVTNMYTSYAGAGGLLVLEPAMNEELLEVHRQERYPTHIHAVPNLNDDHQYCVYVEGEKIEHVSRFAGIIVKELIYETGYIPSLQDLNKGAFDYLHNGLIEIVIDPSTYSKEELSTLDDLMTDLEKYLDITGARAGIQIYKIKLKLTLKKKSEWTMDGEVLDLDKARKEGKPLNERPDVSEEWID